MKHFFSQADQIPASDSLLIAESYLSAQNSSGLIEKQFNADRTCILLFVNGLPGMAYALENDESRPIPLTEFSSLKDEISPTRIIMLPDVAGRLTWLALESHVKNEYSVDGEDAWRKQLDQWKQGRWSGLIEITTKTLHGFALFWQGEIQKSEIIFSTPEGFIAKLPQMENANDFPWEINIYAHTASTQAYQCAILRQGAVDWGHQILSHYQEMVGQKLLQLMDRELNRQIKLWEWKISLDENMMADAHFFSDLGDAAHAYRALFMAMGVQMNFVIGNNLTKRLLSETFQQIHPDERAVLQSQRLIPAAFSE